MLKITKGLKKKKKGKKSKKALEDELFDPAELEKYRREHSGGNAGEEGSAVGGDEWQQFKALTAGVDSVLKKTQGDLDRIKSSSYFQRKPPASETEQVSEKKEATLQKKPSKKSKKRWVGFEEGTGEGLELDQKEEEEDEEEQIQAQEEACAVGGSESVEGAKEQHLEEEEEDEEEEDEEDEDIFDTSYVDVVTSGEVKLAFIPDSPTQEEDCGFDPFDTSIAESIAKEAEAELARRKKLVSLGCAVEVLTGKLEKPDKVPEEVTPGKKRRISKRTDVDLLLGSFDDNGNNIEAHVETLGSQNPVAPPQKTLLDDDSPIATDLPVTIGLPELGDSSLVTPKAESKFNEPDNKDNDLKTLVAEFDLIASTQETSKESFAPLPNPIIVETRPTGDDDDLEDEFAALAAESVAKEGNKEVNEELDDDDPFNTDAADIILGAKPKSPSPPPDPFDIEVATFTSSSVSGERKQSRQFPISPDVDIVLATDSQTNWTPFEGDNDIDCFEASPLQPKPASVINTEVLTDLNDNEPTNAVDPFDTSFAENILPGKVELKLIESEILGSDLEINEARILHTSDSEEFNPRAGEEPVEVQSTVSIHITNPAGEEQKEEPFELSSLTLSHRDLLGGSTTDLSKLGHDPIEPIAEVEQINDIERDPFDTSVVDVIAAPGKVELKYLEEELLGEQRSKITRNLSDEDFDPRAEEVSSQPSTSSKPDLVANEVPQKIVAFQIPTPSERPDLLAVGHEESAKFSKPLTPYYPEPKLSIEELVQTDEDIDPFDTTFVEKLAPGKAELKILESELVGDSQPTVNLRHSLSDPDFDPRADISTGDNQLVSEVASTGEHSQIGNHINFDASVPNLGRRFSELSIQAENQAGNQGRRYSDVTGDRRRNPPSSLSLKNALLPPIQGSKPDLLTVDETLPVTTKPLTPAIEKNEFDEIDPFDTSIASNLLPGKAELKILESELISCGEPSIKRSYTDPDFNPRTDTPEKEISDLEKPDLLNLPEDSAPVQKPLTPGIPEDNIEEEEIDPFDTSIVGNLAPGKAELRILESELFGQ